MTERDNGTQTAKGDGIAQALGAGAIATAEIHHHHHYPETPPAPWNWPRPWDFSGYINEKRHGFTGRGWLFDEVCEWYGDREGAQALLVCADFGFGKSAFMAELTVDPRGMQVAAYHFCHHDTIETLNPATFIRSVAAQLAASLPAYRSAVDADPDACRWLDDAQVDPASACERAVIAPLNAINPPSAPWVLLVDALDEALDLETGTASRHPSTIVRLLASCVRRLPAWLKILGTTRRRQDVLQPVQDAFRCETLNAEDDRNLVDIRSYVVGRCASPKLASVLMDGGESATDLASLLSDARQSRGKFLYAVRVLNGVESGALPLDQINDLPPGLDGFYLDAFQRRFPQGEDYAPVGAVLGVLCVQREPLSRVELAAILGTPEVLVGTLLRRLEDFLQVRAKRYTLDHLSLTQWLTEENEDGFPRAGRFSVDIKVAEVIIAGWARRELAAHRAHESAYLARHLGAYLSPQEHKVQFSRLLPDFRWLDARLRAAGINALLEDCVNVDETPALAALMRALRQSAHVLGHEGSDWPRTELLASQMLGRLQQTQAAPEIHALCAQAAKQLARNAGLRPLSNSLRSAEAFHRMLEGHSDEVRALALLTDGRLASGSEDSTIRLWHPVSGLCETTLEGHTDAVIALATLADGRLASGSKDDTIRLWHPGSGACEAKLDGHTDAVNALAVLADGRVASGSWDATIRLWNPLSGACEARLEGHTAPVIALTVLDDGRLASGSKDNTIKLWNPTSAICEATLEGHRSSVSALAPLADGRLASGSEDATIRLWDPATGMCEVTLEGHTSAVTALAVLADGRLASGALDRIKLWDPATGMCEATLEGHTSPEFALAVLAGGLLASGSGDGTIRLWNPASGADEATLAINANVWADLADGRFASGSTDGTIRLWQPASGLCEATLEGYPNSVVALAMLVDGRLASGSLVDRTIRIWNLVNGACEATLTGHKGSVSALVVLADGRLASGSRDYQIRLWHPTSGACEATLKGHRAAISAFAVLPDGRLASGSEDNTVRLWNPASGVCEATLSGHTDQVSALAKLADGRLASASSDNTIRLWNPASGVCEATLEGHVSEVCALAMLADGRLASSSLDRTIRVWQPRNGRWRGAIQFVADCPIRALTFAMQAGVLVAADDSGRVHFLKVEHLQLPHNESNST